MKAFKSKVLVVSGLYILLLVHRTSHALFVRTSIGTSRGKDRLANTSINAMQPFECLSFHPKLKRTVPPISSKTKLCMTTEPDPSQLLSSRDETTQQLAFATIFALLGLGTALCVQLWHSETAQRLCELVGGYSTIRTQIFPLLFGSIFAVVGVLHFVFVENFARIVPPRQTWGFWNAPAPFQKELGIVSYEYYHSYWTGIAESVGGLWLVAAGMGYTELDLPAFLLFLLTLAVYPANLYMFTHDADPGGAIPKLDYPFGHLARFVIQCGLLSNFWIMSQG